MALRGRKGGKTTETKPSPMARIEELKQAAAEEQRRLREIGAERQEAEGARQSAREALVAAYSRGEDGVAEQKTLEKAEAHASKRWVEIHEAAERRIRAADQAVDQFIVDHFADIRAEKLGRDQRAHERFVAAAQELQVAVRDLNVEANDWTPLLTAKLGMPNGPRGAVLNLESLGQELKRVLSRGPHTPTPAEMLPVERDEKAA